MNHFIKKCLSGCVVLLFLGAGLTSHLLATKQVVNFRTWEFFSSIQDAIDDPDTLNGDSLYVAPDTYQENVWVYKSLSIIGDPHNPPIIAGACTDEVVEITANGVTIKWFVIELVGGSCGPAGAGIRIESSDNIIYKNIIWNCYRGIYLYTSAATGNVLSENTIYNYTNEGILINGASGNWIYSNTVTGNADQQYEDIGICLLGASENAIYANDIQDNNYGIYLGWSNYNKIHHNNFLNNLPYHAYMSPILSPNTGNQWDNGYPSGGNHWSGYTGPDSNNDGIIDNQYYIPEEFIDQDQYPLVFYWQPVCGNVDGDPRGLIDISDISYLIKYLFNEPIGSPEPVPPCAADVNGDGQVFDDDNTYGDIDYLIDFIFNFGPPPVSNCCSQLVLPLLFNQ